MAGVLSTVSIRIGVFPKIILLSKISGGSRYFHIIMMLPAHISMPPAITLGETSPGRTTQTATYPTAHITPGISCRYGRFSTCYDFGLHMLKSKVNGC